MVEEVRQKVYKLLATDKSGHGSEHIERVAKLAVKFARQEQANEEIVTLIALLHDADDYKLFGAESAENLTNTKRILDECGASEEIKSKVVSGIKTIGFSKRLAGITPDLLEAKIVSDADMCDGIGATGILRSYQYASAHDRKFFDKDVFPVVDMNADDYKTKAGQTTVNHLFEKLLLLKNMMLTESGKNEAIARHKIMVDFLYHFFEEENVPEWTAYLNRFLANN